MPISGKLAAAATERGETIPEMIATLLSVHGTPYRVASVLGVYENAVRHWMKTHGGYQYVDGEWVVIDDGAVAPEQDEAHA